MKLFLIKIGKALKVLRRDGILKGGKRISLFFIYFLKIILKPKKGDILIITAGIGDSALFRSQHYAEELNIHNLKCATAIQDDPFLLKYVEKFKIFIFHRPVYTKKIERMVEKIKEQHKEIIFETDDLVFDRKLFQETEAYKQFNALEKKQYEKSIGEELLNDPYVKTCTTTTSFLAEKLRRYDKQVFIVPNKLSNSDLEIVEKIIRKKSGSNSDSIQIGYFRGSAGYNKDFAEITQPLIQIMEKYPQVELLIVGNLTLEKELEKYKEKIILSSYAPRQKHFQNISRCEIILAPLEVGNPFCEAKSELKFFEAGILEVPTVAVKNQTFSEAIIDGVDGFLAGNSQEWFEKMEKLILNDNLRQEMGKKAREKVLEKYTTKNAKNERYYSYLRSKLANLKV